MLTPNLEFFKCYTAGDLNFQFIPGYCLLLRSPRGSYNPSPLRDPHVHWPSSIPLVRAFQPAVLLITLEKAVDSS